MSRRATRSASASRPGNSTSSVAFRSLKDAALAQYLATEEARKATQISLVAAVANGWLTVLGDDEVLEITRQTMVTRDESLELTKLRFDNGVSSEIDFRFAERRPKPRAPPMRSSSACACRTRTRWRCCSARRCRPSLHGQQRGLAGARADADLPAGLPSDLLGERPDIRAAEQQLIAANANIGAARANFFPRVTLTSSIGTASTEFSGLFESGTKAWAFAPQITLPIFDAGRNQADPGLGTRESRHRGGAVREVDPDGVPRSRRRAGRPRDLRRTAARPAGADQRRGRFASSCRTCAIATASPAALDLLDAQRSLYTSQHATAQTRQRSCRTR